jgi:erythromycin esterase-like protein
MTTSNDTALSVIRGAAHPLTGAADDYDRLLERIGNARFVLLGEASHGTHEFYRTRAEITQRLIQEKGFVAVAVEADWPDAYRVNRYVRGVADDSTANEALADFRRFPTWMWRNADVLDFVGWLRDHNDLQPGPEHQVGFYGLDLYSLFRSIEVVLAYLDSVDPDAAKRARYRYSCFEDFGEDAQAYGYAASFGPSESCEREALEQLIELQRTATEYARHDGQLAADEAFFVEQNARVIKNAEQYYRTMFGGRVSSWNLRDRHMVETLQALDAYLSRGGRPARIVMWEHNSHLGDARATEMSARGELNVGQLMRERYGRETILVGFTTYDGTVTAASDWDAPAERKNVRPALPGSYETLFHSAHLPSFDVDLRGIPAATRQLLDPQLERAIGVIYRPQTERTSHYIYARLSEQFDAVIHFDHTRAVEPLERTAEWERGDLPVTYPVGV